MHAVDIDRYRDCFIEDASEAYGKCEELCRMMDEKFPELRLVRGHYYCSSWGERIHWWLENKNGEIIDPTKAQFPSKGNGVYIEWDEKLKEPIGVCPQCGEYIYDNRFTHKECALLYKAYVLGKNE